MKLKLILTTAIVGAALALPSVSNAAPPGPTFQDSVSLPDGPATWFVGDFPPGGTETDAFTELSATSGPNGENATGEVTYQIFLSSFPPAVSDHGPVTCLAVSGSSATLNYQSLGVLGGQIATFHVVDDDPDTVSFLGIGRAATDCSPASPIVTYPLISGDIKVVDAQAPTTRGQCLNDGWKQFGFANQGLCLAFVNRS